MEAEVILIALFNDVSPIPDVLEQLRHHGVEETDMSLLTNLPYPAQRREQGVPVCGNA